MVITIDKRVFARFPGDVSKRLGYPRAPEDRDKYAWNDRGRAWVLLKIWPDKPSPDRRDVKLTRRWRTPRPSRADAISSPDTAGSGT